MDSQQIRERVAEFSRTRSDPGDDGSAQVEAALFVEEVFGIALSDTDMTIETLGTYRDIERFVIGRLLINGRIDEYARTRQPAGDDKAAQVEAALFIEEVFGIALSDDDMTSQHLGTPQAMERLVLERLEQI